MSNPVVLPESFIDALQSLTQWLDDRRVPYSLIGGVAIAFVVEPRATQDIDSLLWLDNKEWKDFLDAGLKYGFVPRIGDALEFANQSRVLLLRHELTGVDIDLSFGATPFEQELLDRTHEAALETFTIRIPTPEDLIVMKAIAGRPKDRDDILRILDAYENLDLARIRHWVGEFAAALEMPEILDSLEQLIQQQGK